MASSTREPRARAWHASVIVGPSMIIWGGRDVEETWQVEVFDPLSGTWLEPRQLHGDSLPRGLYNMAVARDENMAYVFGGYSNSTKQWYNQLFAIDLTSLECRELVPSAGSSSPPSARDGSRMVYRDRQLLIYGGYTGNAHSDELHVFDLDKGSEVVDVIPVSVCVYVVSSVS